jgi:hypothetical protein
MFLCVGGDLRGGSGRHIISTDLLPLTLTKENKSKLEGGTEHCERNCSARGVYSGTWVHESFSKVQNKKKKGGAKTPARAWL